MHTQVHTPTIKPHYNNNNNNNNTNNNNNNNDDDDNTKSTQINNTLVQMQCKQYQELMES